MKTKKIIAVLLATMTIIPTFVSCSGSKETATTTEKVVEVTDADDGTNIIDALHADDDEKSTFDIRDTSGNMLTVVPVYNVDGATIIAGYIQSAKDSKGTVLTAKQYPSLQKIVGIELDATKNPKLMYDKTNNLISLNALADKNGYIIAMQDTIDIDNDKDFKEYFKAVTKVDSNGNLLIKLEKGEDGKPINVTVANDKDGTKKVTTDDGKKIEATASQETENLGNIAKDNNKNNNSSTTKQTTKSTQTTSGNKDKNKTTTSKKEPELDYIPIVLLKGGKVYCDAKNVTVEEGAIDTGTEVIVTGPGKYSKYYITSQTDAFLGHIEFKFNVGDDVEVKFNDVNITTKRKTAINFSNVDKDNDKKDDVESGADDQVDDSLAVEAPAPKVDLSFTGDNYFKATGVGKNGTIYSECRLDIKGHGTAVIDGGSNLSGICSTESIDIRNATLDITSKAKQGISCDRKVTIEYGAKITIDSKGDGIHCNKFEMCNENDFKNVTSSPKPSTLSITSNDPSCTDGIDSNDYIIISGGTVNIERLSNENKYGLKVRKVNSGKESGKFEINGGKVTSSGVLNSVPTSGCTQKTLHIKGVKQVYSVSGFTSPETPSYLCSPCSVNTVSMLNNLKKQTTYDVTWSGNVGKVEGKR